MYSIGWLQSGNMHCIYMRDEGYILCELRLPSFLHFVTYWQKYWLMLSKPIRETIYQAEPDQLWFLNTWEHTDMFLEEKHTELYICQYSLFDLETNCRRAFAEFSMSHWILRNCTQSRRHPSEKSLVAYKRRCWRTYWEKSIFEWHSKSRIC